MPFKSFRGANRFATQAGLISAAAAVAIGCGSAHAAEADGASAQTQPTSSAPAALPAQPPAPLGVFGVDMPAKGKLVLTFAPSISSLRDSQIGTTSVSPQYIVSNVISNTTPVGRHLLRMVPNHLNVDAEGFAVAYGLTPNVTVVGSVPLVQKSVDMEAFKGLSGTTPLGYSTGKTSGVGDASLATVVRVYRDRINQVNLNLGLSLPTGSTTDTMNLLLPNGTAPTKRGFYAMQPGTGTVDGLAGVAYSGALSRWSWGAAYRGRLPVDRNSQGWAYGDLHEVNAWGGYSLLPGLEATLRLNATTQGRIRGDDPVILGYAQGAEPLFYGGRQISAFAGVVVSGRYFALPAAQIGLEVGAPMYQDLNGPQLARELQANAVLRYKL